MAKTLDDISLDLERTLNYALHCAMDDADLAKIKSQDAEVICLQTLSHALCTLAYVLGMGKEGFLKALDVTWENTSKAADKVAEQIEKMMEAKKEEAKPHDFPSEEDTSLKN